MGLLRGRRAVILATVLGLVAAVVSYQYVQQRAALPAPSIEMTQVVVAAADIPSRTKLTSAMVKLEDMPLTAKHANAVTSMKEIEGQVTRLPITAGEQILFKKVSVERTESGLAFVIPPSKRAISIKVNETTGSGGLILPGDHVDIIAVFDAKMVGKDMAVMVLQDIEVLAVAQAMEAVEEAGAAGDSRGGLGSADGSQNAKAATGKLQAQPQAKSITVAVDPEQAQRLVLAEERGKLRIALRPYKENRIADLGEATLGAIRGPLKQGQAQITAVSISPTQLKVGETMTVEVTVKNISAIDIKSQGPGQDFTYTQGQTFHSESFPSQPGAYRVGINFAGQSPVEFPYRWGFGPSLPPGASATVVGHIRFTSDFNLTNFWAGLILEPAEVVEDNVGMSQVMVTSSNATVVAVDMALIRSKPSISSGVVDSLSRGTELNVLGREADWYEIEVSAN
ncbi:MAG: Flp pilus assembly protein CpaB, partial [Chloroflexota bacterium]